MQFFYALSTYSGLRLSTLHTQVSASVLSRQSSIARCLSKLEIPLAIALPFLNVYGSLLVICMFIFQYTVLYSS